MAKVYMAGRLRKIPRALSASVERIDSLFAFELGHRAGDPLLQVVFEPGLYTIRKPDGFSLEQFGGRRPGGAHKDSFSSCRQVFTTHEIAKILNTVKLQVAVEVSGAELVPVGELLIDSLHDLLHLLLIGRVILANRRQ